MSEYHKTPEATIRNSNETRPQRSLFFRVVDVVVAEIREEMMGAPSNLTAIRPSTSANNDPALISICCNCRSRDTAVLCKLLTTKLPTIWQRNVATNVNDKVYCFKCKSKNTID